MITTTLNTSIPPTLSNNNKIVALEITLHQSLLDFKELLVDLEQLQIESDNYKTQYMQQKAKCDSKACSSANDLKKAIESKDTIIQLVASTLTRLSETKDWTILDEVFKILFGESTTPTLSHLTSTKNKENHKITAIKEEIISPKKEIPSLNEDLSFKDDSVSEIEGTPTGRTSPIIQTKKLKTSMVTLPDKKKCPDAWPTPESKSLKLTYTTPTRSKQNSKLRQSRLNVVKTKSTSVIDITSSPEFSGGTRCRTDSQCNVQPIKKEAIDNDDTILPSPTSGPTTFTLFKSPMKFKKPPLSLKSKSDKTNNISKWTDQDAENRNIKTEKNSTGLADKKKHINEIKTNDSETYTQDDSINILHPNRLPVHFIKSSPVKRPAEDTTFFDTQASVSLLHNINKLDDLHQVNNVELSPSKRPLADNINITNTQNDEELQASLSLLQPDKCNRLVGDLAKRIIVDLVPEECEERVPRTRAEKRLLPGWACAQCIDFFGELHKDDPELMRKKINACSHHRGQHNPERAKTPPNYWNPRMNVPDDTEEFNRRNNV